MALRVWLPLNGNINNYGISDVTVTNNGATVDNNGKIGKCYSFNGGSAKISASINLTPAMSFCTWVKFNSVQNFVIDARNSSGQGYQPMYISSTGVQIYSSGSPSGGYINYSFSTNVWYHLVVSYSNNKGYLYVNGTLVGTTGVASLTLNNSILTIGSRYSSERSLNGSLNDVRVYDHALSAKEVKEISKGLCLHYKLDGLCNTIDSTEWDCSGFGNNGIKSGNITLVDSGGRYSKAYSFPNNCNTRIYSTVAPKLLKNLTFSCWCKVQQGSNSTWSFIVSQGRDNTADGFNIILNSSLHYCIHGPFGTVDSGVSANNTWTHVVGTYDGANVKIFINGILKNTQAYTANLVYNYAPAFVIGKMSYNYTSDGSYFPTNGAISDVRVYATALSDADVLELYNTSLSIDNVGNMYTYEFKEIE